MNYDVSKMAFLGQGSFGIVYKANEHTALKMVHVGTDQKLKQLALDEIDFMIKITRQSGSNNITKITGYDKLPDRIYVKMELASDSMTSFMKKPEYTKLKLVQKIDMLMQVFAGLAFLHSRDPQVIHQDLKPLNILMFLGLEAKLADFGLASSKTHASITLAEHSTVDSIPYIAPEVLVGVPIKTKMLPQTWSNVWSLCSTGVEWMKGRFPWQLDEKLDVRKQIKEKQKCQQPPEELGRVVPYRVREVLGAGLSYNYSSRPSAGSIRQQLEQLKQTMAREELEAVHASPPSSRDSGIGSRSSGAIPAIGTMDVIDHGADISGMIGDMSVASDSDVARSKPQTKTLSAGARYTGQMKKGLAHGYGTLIFTSGDKYTGEFANDNFRGQGTYLWPSGQKYVGAWKDGLRHGTGTHTFPSGDTYTGNYANDKKNGQGTNMWPDGQKYVGAWKDDVRHGTGTHTFPDGETYTGKFANDKKNGQGTTMWPDSSKYVGAWRDDKMHGSGTLTEGGKTTKGTWINGVLQ